MPFDKLCLPVEQGKYPAFSIYLGNEGRIENYGRAICKTNQFYPPAFTHFLTKALGKKKCRLPSLPSYATLWYTRVRWLRGHTLYEKSSEDR
jgi:hypothetical protein